MMRGSVRWIRVSEFRGPGSSLLSSNRVNSNQGDLNEVEQKYKDIPARDLIVG
jgi:hypothetical protein